jgi:hypothetical protein
MLADERDAFLELRDRLDDEIIRRVHSELDLKEAMLAREQVGPNRCIARRNAARATMPW